MLIDFIARYKCNYITFTLTSSSIHPNHRASAHLLFHYCRSCEWRFAYTYTWFVHLSACSYLRNFQQQLTQYYTILHFTLLYFTAQFTGLCQAWQCRVRKLNPVRWRQRQVCYHSATPDCETGYSNNYGGRNTEQWTRDSTRDSTLMTRRVCIILKSNLVLRSAADHRHVEIWKLFSNLM